MKLKFKKIKANFRNGKTQLSNGEASSEVSPQTKYKLCSFCMLIFITEFFDTVNS